MHYANILLYYGYILSEKGLFPVEKITEAMK